MTALVLSDTAIAEPIGYVFIAPVMTEVRGREHVTASVSAVDGYAILWRMQAVTYDNLAKGEPVGRATTEELNEIDRILAALLGLPLH
jgi:mRNA-degrading endonuclease toxin of MazEF toxin-antitoxin module